MSIQNIGCYFSHLDTIHKLIVTSKVPEFWRIGLGTIDWGEVKHKGPAFILSKVKCLEKITDRKESSVQRSDEQPILKMISIWVFFAFEFSTQF